MTFVECLLHINMPVDDPVAPMCLESQIVFLRF
jgi:hypothetical protein